METSELDASGCKLRQVILENIPLRRSLFRTRRLPIFSRAFERADVPQDSAAEWASGGICLARYGARGGAIRCRGGIVLPAVFNNSLMRSLNVCVLSSVLISRQTFERAGRFAEGMFAEDW